METEIAGDVARVRGFERLSSENGPQLKERVAECLKAGQRIIEVDFADVSFVDSEGLGALIAIRRAATQHSATVRLLHPKPHVLQVFDLVQFRRIFDIVQ